MMLLLLLVEDEVLLICMCDFVLVDFDVLFVGVVGEQYVLFLVVYVEDVEDVLCAVWICMNELVWVVGSDLLVLFDVGFVSWVQGGGCEVVEWVVCCLVGCGQLVWVFVCIDDLVVNLVLCLVEVDCCCVLFGI